jgi:hypothetical protein
MRCLAERLMPGAPGKPGAHDAAVLNYIDLPRCCSSWKPLVMLAGMNGLTSARGCVLLSPLEDLVPGCDDQHWGPVPAPMR